jgi:prepilin-type N-terminal cleavage/methylation domain-containing protein
MRRRRRTAAFSLMEIIVALAILAILGATTLPTIKSGMDRAYVAETATRLQALRDGIYNPATGANAFFQVVGSYPGRLSQLSTAIVAQDATNSPNSCGGSYPNGAVNKWIASGPFVKYTIEPGVGLGTPMGRIDDVLIREPANAAPGVLKMILPEAELDLVARLDLELNSGDGSGAGSVQWTPSATNVTTMSFEIPVGNKC